MGTAGASANTAHIFHWPTQESMFSIAEMDVEYCWLIRIVNFRCVLILAFTFHMSLVLTSTPFRNSCLNIYIPCLSFKFQQPYLADFVSCA